MPNYRVAVDSVTGKNRIFLQGQQVTSDQFAEGLADRLELQGFLERLPDDISVQQPEVYRKPKMDDHTRLEIMEKLRQAGIKFSENASKVELYEMLR